MADWLPEDWTLPPELTRQHILDSLDDLIEMGRCAGEVDPAPVGDYS
jgi:hypothetical protein